MSTKLLMYSAIVALLFASVAHARTPVATPDVGQEQAVPAPNSENRPNLNLTDDQKVQMKRIHEDAKSQMDAVNNDSSLSADQKQTKIKQIRRESHKQVQAMLTPEQRKTMKQWRHEHRGQRNSEAPTAG
jgi:Spy/CpxP family protein refolding chaperone